MGTTLKTSAAAQLCGWSVSSMKRYAAEWEVLQSRADIPRVTHEAPEGRGRPGWLFDRESLERWLRGASAAPVNSNPVANDG